MLSNGVSISLLFCLVFIFLMTVAILDYEHQIIDPGTAYELGAATMMKKPMIVFQEETVPTNLMITQSLHTYLKTVDEVRDYDFKTLPVTKYVGEYL